MSTNRYKLFNNFTITSPSNKEAPEESPIEKRVPEETQKSETDNSIKAKVSSEIQLDNVGYKPKYTQKNRYFASIGTKQKDSAMEQSQKETRKDGDRVFCVFDFLKPEYIRDANFKGPYQYEYNPTTLHVPEHFLRTQSPAQQQWWKKKASNFDSGPATMVQYLNEFANAELCESALTSKAPKVASKAARVETETSETMQERRSQTLKKFGTPDLSSEKVFSLIKPITNFDMRGKFDQKTVDSFFERNFIEANLIQRSSKDLESVELEEKREDNVDLKIIPETRNYTRKITGTVAEDNAQDKTSFKFFKTKNYTKKMNEHIAEENKTDLSVKRNKKKAKQIKGNKKADSPKTPISEMLTQIVETKTTDNSSNDGNEHEKVNVLMPNIKPLARSTPIPEEDILESSISSEEITRILTEYCPNLMRKELESNAKKITPEARVFERSPISGNDYRKRTLETPMSENTVTPQRSTKLKFLKNNSGERASRQEPSVSKFNKEIDPKVGVEEIKKIVLKNIDTKLRDIRCLHSERMMNMFIDVNRKMREVYVTQSKYNEQANVSLQQYFCDLIENETKQSTGRWKNAFRGLHEVLHRKARNLLEEDVSRREAFLAILRKEINDIGQEANDDGDTDEE